MTPWHTHHCTRAAAHGGAANRQHAMLHRTMLLPWLVGAFWLNMTMVRAQDEQRPSGALHQSKPFSLGIPDGDAADDQPALEGQQEDNFSNRSKSLSLGVQSPGAIVPPMDPNAPPYTTYAAPGWGAYAPPYWGGPYGAAGWPYSYWPPYGHHPHLWPNLPRGSQFYFGHGYGSSPRPAVPYGYRYPGYPGYQYPGYPPGYRGNGPGYGYPRGTAPGYPGGYPPGYGYPGYQGYPPAYRNAPPSRNAPPPPRAPSHAPPHSGGAARPYRW